VWIVQQLLKPGAEPTFGPTKTGRPRTVALSPETVDLLRAHRKHQRELMMANRATYRDLGCRARGGPEIERKPRRPSPCNRFGSSPKRVP
jgi:hypothetical protein